MHQQVRAPGVEMKHRRTHLGLFRTWGKTWEARDPLGESCISFRPLSLLTIRANTSTDQEHCFPQSRHHHPSSIPWPTRAGPHQLYPSIKPSTGHLISVRCAKRHKTNNVAPFLICYGCHQHHMWRRGFIWGSWGQWDVAGCNAFVEGDFISFFLSLLCPTYMNNERKWEESI